MCCFFFQAEDGIRDGRVTGVQTCALPISAGDQADLEAVSAEREEELAESDAAADAGPGAPAGDDDGEAAGEGEEEAPAADLEQESEIAADYIEGLLDVADLDGDIDMDVEGDRPVVSVVGATLSELVGPHGEVLEALQELTRLALHRQAAEQVSQTGVPQRLEAMTPFERKVVHDAVAAAGLRSESEGEEPSRRVVVLPAEEAAEAAEDAEDAEDAVMEPAGGQG